MQQVHQDMLFHYSKSQLAKGIPRESGYGNEGDTFEGDQAILSYTRSHNKDREYDDEKKFNLLRNSIRCLQEEVSILKKELFNVTISEYQEAVCDSKIEGLDRELEQLALVVEDADSKLVNLVDFEFLGTQIVQL